MITLNKQFKTFCALGAVAIFLAVPGCKTTKVPEGSAKQEVLEIMPGLLQGYLAQEEIPNSLALIPPPPEDGSTAYLLDQYYAKKAVDSNDTARYHQAFIDAELHFPVAVKSFEPTLGIEISETKTPNLYILLRRVLTDAGLSTYAAKNHYKRQRPFMLNNTHTCTPKDEEGLRKDGSYPSGHTAIGWAWALVLCEIFPAKTDAILQRGYAFGESRVVCNVHWHSDVEMGRVVGASAVARLHANPTFQSDLAAAKKEVKKIVGVQ